MRGEGGDRRTKVALAGVAFGGVLLLAIAGLFVARALPAATASGPVSTVRTVSPAASAAAATPTRSSWPVEPVRTPTAAPTNETEWDASVVDAGIIGAGFVHLGVWAVQPGHLFTTIDGGATWRKGSIPPADMNISYDEAPTVMVDQDHAWTLRAGPGSDRSQDTQYVSLLVYRTTDGGATWQYVSIPGNFFASQFRLLFADPLHGYLITNQWQDDATTVYRTDDGGATWTAFGRTSVGTQVALTDVTTIWTSVVYGGPMCGWCNQPLLRVSRDGGASWSIVDLPGYEGVRTDYLLGAVSPPVFISATVGYVAVHDASINGGGRLTTFFRTNDGGRTWTSAGRVERWVTGFMVKDAGQLLSWSRELGPFGVSASSDAGATWRSLDYSERFFTSGAPFFVDGDLGGVVVPAESGLEFGRCLYITRDGGATWHPAVLPYA